MLFWDELISYSLELSRCSDTYLSDPFSLYTDELAYTVESEFLYKAALFLPEKLGDILFLDFWIDFIDCEIDMKLESRTYILMPGLMDRQGMWFIGW